MAPALPARAFVLALLLPAAASGQAVETAQPLLGPLDQSARLIGSVTGGLPGETWAYRQLPFDVGPPVADGAPLAFGPVLSALRPDPQLAFVRYTDAAGWQVAQTPRDRDGMPWRGVVPNPSAARVLPGGGGVLVGRDANAAPDDQAKLLVRDPGGLFTEVPPPQPPVVRAAGDPEPGDARETIATDRGLGAVAAAGYEILGKTRVLVAPRGRAVEDGILRWDGREWAREPIELPSPAPVSFEVVALDATDGANAWLLAAVRLPDDPLAPLGETAQPGIVLYERVVADGVASWRLRELGAPFAAAETVVRGIDGLRALAGGAQQALTVTAGGVWIDGELRAGAAERAQDFTLYFDVAAGRVTRSWCDARDSAGVAVCDAPLGFAFSRRTGYRSIAFGGAGSGARIVSNPLDPGGDETSNGGTYARFDDAAVSRLPAGNGNLRASAAFASPSSGWLEGPVQVGAGAPPARLERRSVSVRAPFTAVAGEPGKAPGAADAAALAVGASGAVARFVPGQGWAREFLLTSAGAVTSPALRGVAWPERGRAYAVGDLGAMWLWRADTGLWERDGATPVGLEANLLGVAFQPGSDVRGYAVGRAGTLLRYDKTWTPEPLPAGIEGRDLTSIAFAGGQAIVAAGADLLVNEGGAWRVDEQAGALLASVPGSAPQLQSVAGLPDGGAVAAGRNVVIVRDGAGLPWRFTDQPLPGATAIAAAAFRDGPLVRAVVSVVPRVQYPPSEDLPAVDPDVPPPILPPTPLPGDGYVLREVAGGWRDEQRAAFNGAGADRPSKPDPVLAFDLDAGGQGWAVGGWSGEADSAGRGSSARNAIGRNNRLRVQTAAIYRYAPGGGAAGTAGAVPAGVALDPGVASFAVAGHAQCEGPCAQLAGQAIGPDRMLESVVARAGVLARAPGGPRFLLYSGGRNRAAGVAGGQPPAEARRYASLLGSGGGLPVYPAVSAGDAEGGSGAAAFRAAFAGFPAPLGDGPAPGGIAPLDTAGGGAARTHYAFDSTGAGGTLRVVVIDNSRGSLAASDPYQNPPEPQAPWLAAQLAAARARSIPAVVMGSRDLNSRFAPALNVATDGDEVARILLDGGASAYFFERPEENRAGAIPAGSAVTIPQYGTGTLGYRSPLSNTIAPGQPDALFGDAGFLLAEVDAARRDPASNRAPVRVRLMALIEDLALLAVDGILLRRSRPALFQGLGRKPIAGDRWGEVAGSDGNPNPPGGDPYTAFPAAQCAGPTCASRVQPEFTFSSSDPDIADFVRQDPASTNLRKPVLDATDRVVTDAASGLLCPFNAGTTTVTISAGGLAFSQRVTVLAGSVQRPCGTRPLDPSRFTAPAPAAVAAPAPAGSAPPAPSGAPAVPPVPQLPAAKAVPKPAAKRPAPGAPPQPPAILPPLPGVSARVPGAPPPGTSGFARPIPPGGATVRAFERKREEEAAPEQSQAFARYRHDDDRIAPYLLGMIVLAAIAGAGAGRGIGRRRERPAYATAGEGGRRPAQDRERRPHDDPRPPCDRGRRPDDGDRPPHDHRRPPRRL